MWLVTTKVKVTSPPVSGTLVGDAVLTTVMSGRTSTKVTVASSLSVAVLPSSSDASAVTTLTCGVSESDDRKAVIEQE